MTCRTSTTSKTSRVQVTLERIIGCLIDICEHWDVAATAPPQLPEKTAPSSKSEPNLRRMPCDALWHLANRLGTWNGHWPIYSDLIVLISDLSLWGNNGNHKGTGSTESCPANLGQGMFWHVTRSLGFVDIGVASGTALYINSWHQLVSVYLYVKRHQQFDDLIRSAPNKSSGGLATSAAGACGDKLIKREGLEGLAAGGAGRLTRASHDRRPLNSIANAIEGMLTHNSHDGFSTHLKIDVKTMWKSCPISK